MWRRKTGKIDIKPIGDSRPYVLWRRVSTQEQEVSGLGLEAQLTIAKMFMAKVVNYFRSLYLWVNLQLNLCKMLLVRGL